MSRRGRNRGSRNSSTSRTGSRSPSSDPGLPIAFTRANGEMHVMRVPLGLQAQVIHTAPAPPYSGPPEPATTTTATTTPPLPTPVLSPTLPMIPQAEVLDNLQRIEAVRQRHRQLQARETALPINVRQFSSDVLSTAVAICSIIITYACFVSIKGREWLRRAFCSLAILAAASSFRCGFVGIALLVLLATMFINVHLKLAPFVVSSFLHQILSYHATSRSIHVP